jgi:hypothetical protein
MQLIVLISPERALMKYATGSRRRFISTREVSALSKVRWGYPLYLAIIMYVPRATTGLKEVLAKAAMNC